MVKNLLWKRSPFVVPQQPSFISSVSYSFRPDHGAALLIRPAPPKTATNGSIKEPATPLAHRQRPRQLAYGWLLIKAKPRWHEAHPPCHPSLPSAPVRGTISLQNIVLVGVTSTQHPPLNLFICLFFRLLHPLLLSQLLLPSAILIRPWLIH